MACGEGGGHGVAMPRHVAHLARGEPELHEQAGDQREREGQRKARGAGRAGGIASGLPSVRRSAAGRLRGIDDNRPMPESTEPTAPATLKKSDQNLVWLDCEMTGLDPETDRIIEIAVVVTDPDLHAAHRRPGARDPPERRGARRAWTPGTRARTAAAA